MKQKNRKTIRLRDYDYTRTGMYFITVCCEGHKCVLGKVGEGKVLLKSPGKILNEELIKTPDVSIHVKIDCYTIMPNHFHAVIGIKSPVGATRRVAPTTTLPAGSLGAIVGQIKSISTKRIRKTSTPDFKWQRDYYEHVIRNEKELNAIREYIHYNPSRWQFDLENLNGKQDKTEQEFWKEFTYIDASSSLQR